MKITQNVMLLCIGALMVGIGIGIVIMIYSWLFLLCMIPIGFVFWKAAKSEGKLQDILNTFKKDRK